MKKALFVAMMMLVSVGVAGVTPLLFEAFQEGEIYILPGESDTVTVTEVSFSVDSACYVQFAAGGMARRAKLWLAVNGSELPPLVYAQDPHVGVFVNLTYTYFLAAGEHTVSLRLSNHVNVEDPTTCKDSYLQALIFLPDTGSGVAEPPLETRGLSPLSASIVSLGPYVNVAGATELVDAAGRVIENAIENDKVYLSNLSTGTYFARDGERTIVKIVKVE
jgi:hypothetical protein